MENQTRNVLVGSLLGDGWLETFSPRVGTSRYRVKYRDHSLGYLQWIRKKVSELEPSEIKEKKEYSQHYFYTRAREDLEKMRRIFYPNEGPKRVPSGIENLLTTPLSLAIWYQDDGTLDRRSKYHWNARIATYCFPYEDCVRLQKVLRSNFGIDVSVCRNQMRGKVYYELYVRAKSMERFVATIRPYIHSNFAYKILQLAHSKE
jgi:LAGLIDADG DNA endonuclease family protein